LRFHQKENAFNLFNKKTNYKNCSAIARIDDIQIYENTTNKSIFTVTVKKLLFNGQLLNEIKEISLKIFSTQNKKFKVGDTVKIHSLFFRDITNNDYKKYLIKESLGGYIYTNQPFTLIYRPKYSIIKFIKETRNCIYLRLKNKIPQKTFILFSSIFFGNKVIDEKSFEPIKENFKKWGIIHYLARPGLHLVIFIILFSFLMSYLPIHYSIKEILMILIVIIYTALSWPSISFIRALVVFIFYKFTKIFDLQPNPLYHLIITCLIILLYNPFQLFFLDFQLSFSLTFALLLLNTYKILEKQNFNKVLLDK
jgi:competence protein ComEC